MSGRVEREDMSEERIRLLDEVVEFFDDHLPSLVGRLIEAAHECPRVSCATCLAMTRHYEEHRRTP